MEIRYEITPAQINRGVSILVYGEAGRGKTHMAGTLPRDETLFVITECGMGPLLGKGFNYFDVLAAMKNNPLMPLEEIISEFYKSLRTNPKLPFKYIVIDNLTELENQLLGDYTKRRKKPFPEAKEYGDVAYRIHEWVTLFRDLQYQGITVIFNTWEKQYEMKSQTGESYTMTYPFLSGRNAAQIPGLVDAVGYLQVITGGQNGPRWLVQFGPDPIRLTKCQFQGLGREEANLMTILNKIKEFNYAEHEPVNKVS